MEFSRRRLKLKIEGTQYDLKWPNVKDLKKFRGMSEDKKNDPEDAFLTLLDDLGLPYEVGETLEADWLTQISEKLFPVQQKKSQTP
tara:strand:- start:259 stop:516 length:258 start_codon:yes stop_codon:yes gene_type:complete